MLIQKAIGCKMFVTLKNTIYLYLISFNSLMKAALNSLSCTATTYILMIKFKCNLLLSIKSHQAIQIIDISKSHYSNKK